MAVLREILGRSQAQSGLAAHKHMAKQLEGLLDKAGKGVWRCMTQGRDSRGMRGEALMLQTAKGTC